MTIDYQDLAGLNLWTAESPSNITVQRVGLYDSAGTVPIPVAITAGTASDKITVDNPVFNGVNYVGGLNINGAGGSLIVNDSATPAGFLVALGLPASNTVTFTVTGQMVTDDDEVQQRIIGVAGGKKALPPPSEYTVSEALTYSNLHSLAITGGPADQTFNVQSTTSGTPVTITGGATSETFQVGNPTSAGAGFRVGTDSVKSIKSQLTLTGNGAGSATVIDDSAATTSDHVTVGNGPSGPVQVGMGATNKFFASGGGLSASDMGVVAVYMSRAAGDIIHATPFTSTGLSLNGNAAELHAGNACVLDLDTLGGPRPVGSATSQLASGALATASRWLTATWRNSRPRLGSAPPGGTYNGRPFAATATITTGPGGTPASTLQGVGLTFDYQQLNSAGNIVADLVRHRPDRRGPLPGDRLLRRQRRLLCCQQPAGLVHDHAGNARGPGPRSGRHLQQRPAISGHWHGYRDQRHARRQPGRRGADL